MSNNLSKCWTYNSGLLEPNSRVAIDIMPLAYKYLYVGDMTTAVGPLRSNDVITSYIYHLLRYILKLRKLKIQPYVCLDDHCMDTNDLKQSVINERAINRQKKLEQYSHKIESHTMTSSDWKTYNCAKYYLGKKDLAYLANILISLGVKVFSYPGMEAETYCAFLKKTGLADYCFSTDKDITLYGVDALVSLNPESGFYLQYNYKEMLEKNNLKNHDQMLYCAIAAGLDYSRGVPKIGPANALKKINSDFANFKDMVQSVVGPERTQKIKQLFKIQFPLEKYEHLLNKSKSVIDYNCTDLSKLQLDLEELNFSPHTIMEIINTAKSSCF